MKTSFTKILAVASLTASTVARRTDFARNILLTNDDGWAVAQLRDEYNQLRAAGYEVILSAPAVDKSGTDSSTTTPTPLTTPCQFDTCPIGSPATGTDAHDRELFCRLVDAARFGIQNFAEMRWGKKPDFVVSGSNLGNNLGPVVNISGTVGAAGEAAKEGVPSFAFSGGSGSSVIYTTLTSEPDAASTIDAKIYTSLILKFLSTYLAGCSESSPIVPHGFSVNINFSPVTSCSNNAKNFKWVATRLLPSTSNVDTSRCGSRNLPDETTVSQSGCFATVSVFNVTAKQDAPAALQKVVFDRLHSLLTCVH
ncbi:Acid phosphatase [Leucoagaricus sp. SymC.cos]|nr:Acid phosphatase [Leucoagaricus sp. SymC.cos]